MERQKQSKRSSEGYTTPQRFGKAVKRLKSQSPSKKLANKAPKTGKNKGLSEEIKDKAVNCYYLSDLVYTVPALKDEMTEAGKTKMRKYYLTMYLREVFAMFKGENKDCEIGFSLFASLRRKNVLLLKNQPLDQCKCLEHENSYLVSLSSILTKYDFGRLYCVVVRIIHQVFGKENVMRIIHQVSGNVNVITVTMEKPFHFLI